MATASSERFSDAARDRGRRGAAEDAKLEKLCGVGFSPVVAEGVAAMASLEAADEALHEKAESMEDDAGSTSSGSLTETSGSDTEGESDDDPIDLSSKPDPVPANAPPAPPHPTPPPCPDCRQAPAPGQTVCICGLPLPKPPVPPNPAKKPQPRKPNKASKVHRWYVEVARRLTGVPSFVIKDAQLVYRKALKETSRQGCTEQGEQLCALCAQPTTSAHERRAPPSRLWTPRRAAARGTGARAAQAPARAAAGSAV